MKSPNQTNQAGFTLIELLVVISLLAIAVGVTGDIVVSLVRSYSKTQITTEVEQNATFVLTKIEKELRNASQVTLVEDDTLTFVRRKEDGTNETITYSVLDSSVLTDGTAGVYFIGRDVDGAGVVPVTNYSFPTGVTVITGGSIFADVSGVTGPQVIKISLSMRQAGNPAVQFTQSTNLETTVVVRGSY